MKVLKVQMFHGKEMKGWETFRKDVVKVGTLRSSDLCLEGLGRMHAVFEQSMGEGWRLIDLGANPPCYVNGEQVRNATLRSGDTVHFGPEGPWSLRVTIEEEAEVEVEEKMPWTHEDFMAQAVTSSRHEDAFKGLCQEVLEFAAECKDDSLTGSIRQMESLWKSSRDDETRRKYIRRLVKLVRGLREAKEKAKVAERITTVGLASVIRRAFTTDWMERILTMPEDEAVEKALSLMGDLVHCKQVADEVARSTKTIETEHEEERECVQRGHARIREAVTTRAMVIGTEFTLCAARAGGWSWEKAKQRVDGTHAQTTALIRSLAEKSDHPKAREVLAMLDRVDSLAKLREDPELANEFMDFLEGSILS